MTLDTAQIGRLTRLIEANRNDWDAQGILSHVEKLATDPRSWVELQVQAVTRSADFKQTTPACLLRSLSVPPSLPGVRPEPTPECAEHGGTIRDDRGRYACCVQAAIEAEKAAHPLVEVRGSHGPPPAVKAKIQEMQRKATR